MGVVASVPNPSARDRHVVIIGAGPAGLTAGVELTRAGVPVSVLEKDRRVGGIARTETYKGYHFDIGGHRFFTKIGEVEQFWRDLCGDDFRLRPRISRVFYEGKFYDYPLKPFQALANLGLLTSLHVALSYLHAQAFPSPREDTFEEWVSNRFGRKLYRIFFKTYTEKVWGIPCSEIRAEWAAQRIQGLSLPVAIRNALFGPQGQEVIKTLIEQFHYPRLGPGQLWQKAADFVAGRGGRVELEAEVVCLHHVADPLQTAGRRVTHVMTRRNSDGGERVIEGADFISTMPISELVRKLDPPPPPDVLAAANGLTYRDFLSVILIVNQPHLFPDNWIYVHSPEVRVGRVQNFKNWSPDMVPDQSKTSLGLEYFCAEGDELWRMPDAELVELGKREMERISLARASDVMDGTVVRQPKAYPVYNGTYANYLATLKDYLATFSNLQTVGRNGLHKYNNQDHSMLTAMLAARNVLHPAERRDVWNVNTERSYHEEMRLPPHSALSADEAGAEV
jgi:protoporphyrinogen oxidase